MSTTPKKSADELREERFARYLKAAGIETNEPLYKSVGMLEWLEKNAFPKDKGLSTFLACPVYRMLKRLDTISVISDPLGLNKPPQYDVTKGEEWIKYCVKTRIRGISAEWGGDTTQSRFNQLNAKIQRRINERTDGNFRVDQPAEKYETFAGGFEQIPTFGLFPFYLHKERLRNWHVLPFAALTELGMVMDEALARVVLAPEHSMRSSDLGAEITITLDDLRTIISNVEMNNSHRFLYLGGGHAAYRIILNSLEAEKYGLLRMNLDDIHTVLEKSPKAGDLQKIIKKSDSATRYILLSDLGDRLYSILRRRKRNKSNGLVWVKIKLVEPVPVGIGFSLFTMAKFLKMPILFRDISEILLENFDGGDSAFISALEEEGIKLNGEYINYLNLLTTEVPTQASKKTEIIKEDELKTLKETLRTRLQEIRVLAMEGDPINAHKIDSKFAAWLIDISKIVDVGVLESKIEKVGLIDMSRPTNAMSMLEKIFNPS